MTSSQSDQVQVDDPAAPDSSSERRQSAAIQSVRDFLERRQSEPMLIAPAPAQGLLEGMLGAIARSPDHGNLKPYRFKVLSGPALQQLGDVLLQAELASSDGTSAEPSASLQEKIRAMPLRAPMVIVGIVQLNEPFKIPAVEQWMAAGCAVQTLLLMLQNEGYGAMWRSGKYAYDASVATTLGLAEHERICAFVYCGTISQTKRNRPTSPPQDSLMTFHSQL